MNEDINRMKEWFVPKVGPVRFRVAIGILYLPYTAMCLSFTIIGALVSTVIYWDRIVAMIIIYFFALGIGAHFADNLGSPKSPWGNRFGKKISWIIIILSLSIAYAIGIYYIVFFVPLLSLLAVLEGFFLFSYNFEKFSGYFHTDFWFAIAWGVLPVLAGYVMQTNTITVTSIFVAAIAGFISYVEIVISRPYKTLRRQNLDSAVAQTLERFLKIISLGTLAIAFLSLALRILLG